jgi:hypothetical protein
MDMMQIDSRLTELAAGAKARSEAKDKARRLAEAEKTEQEYQRDVAIFDSVLRQELGEYVDLLSNLQFRRANAVLHMQAAFALPDPQGRSWTAYFELDNCGAKNGEIVYSLDKLWMPDLTHYVNGPKKALMISLSPKGHCSWPEALAISLTSWQDEWAIINEVTERQEVIDQINQATRILNRQDNDDRVNCRHQAKMVNRAFERLACDRAMQQSKQIKAWVKSQIQPVEALNLYKWSWCKGAVHEDGEWYFEFDDALSHSDLIADGWIQRTDGERIRLDLDRHRPTVETITLALDKAHHSQVREHAIELVGVEEFSPNQFRYCVGANATMQIRVFCQSLDPTIYPTRLQVPHELAPLNDAETIALEDHVNSIIEF